MRDRSKWAAAARACVGVRFRLHGRDPAFGLDCVGLAGWTFGVAAPGGYALRGGDPNEIARRIEVFPVLPVVPEAAMEGDLVLIAAGSRQYHLAVLTDAGFVHADAGLRRVVETPGRPANVIGAWRAKEA